MLLPISKIADWYERAAEGGGGGGEFVALRLPAPPVVAALPDIRIELRRGATTVSVSWPTQEAGACAVWLGQWLR